jgi:hypothetical protein
MEEVELIGKACWELHFLWRTMKVELLPEGWLFYKSTYQPPENGWELITQLTYTTPHSVSYPFIGLWLRFRWFCKS